MIQEFKDFINKGNVLMVAVGLIMALYFQKIVDAFLNGVINPIIAAIFGEPNFTAIGFTLREGENGEPDTRVSIGLVIDAAISFVLVAFVLFLIVRTYNRTRHTAEGTPAGPTEIELLTEIRDALRNR